LDDLLPESLMSYAAGKWLTSWFWRLVVLSWTLLLLNLVLFHKAVIGPWGGTAFDSHLLAFAFVSVQFCLIATWLVFLPERLDGVALSDGAYWRATRA
jgi:hypothetical protein